jgi:hypothetical protein
MKRFLLLLTLSAVVVLLFAPGASAQRYSWMSASPYRYGHGYRHCQSHRYGHSAP